MRKLNIKRFSKLIFAMLAVPMLALIFCACGLPFDPSGLTPEIFVESDGRVVYDELNEVYKVDVLIGENYVINANLGDYNDEEDGGGYYIDYVLEDSKTSLATLTDNNLLISQTAMPNEQVVVLIRVRKTGEEKIYRTEKLIANIVFETTK